MMHFHFCGDLLHDISVNFLVLWMCFVEWLPALPRGYFQRKAKNHVHHDSHPTSSSCGSRRIVSLLEGDDSSTGVSIDESSAHPIDAFPPLSTKLLDFDPYDDSCTECGACCSLLGDHVSSDRGYVELLQADMKNLDLEPKKHKHLLVRKQGKSPGTSGFFLKVLPPGPQGARCPFLVDDITHGASCGVYERRPAACRFFKKSSWACIEMRKRHFLNGHETIRPRYIGRVEGREKLHWLFREVTELKKEIVDVFSKDRM